ncbi:MAG: hypothetical protein ACJ731_12685, partial [Vicinamibacterales bacterium]
MKHLSRIEVVDLVESSGTLPVDRLRHLESCEWCRNRAETLRAMRSIASADETPEPSPLFWKHFSARDTEQLRGEPAPAPASGWSAGAPLATWAAVGTLVVLLVGVAVSWTTVHAPAPDGRAAASAPAGDLGAVEPFD